MTSEPKADLHRYLTVAREALLWKLDGLSDYDIRRPMTSTGTNLLGLVKHVAGCEIAYFGASFARPYPTTYPWLADDAPPNADMWATATESRAHITTLYRDVWAHSDHTIETHPLEARAVVPHWPADRAETTLHRLLIHMIAETHRHAGHADILRETLDGAAGHRESADNMPEGDAAWWAKYRSELERVAREAGGTEA
ncbi:DinB family protein [Actinokineospora globicatena]|uniref:DinB superfamily protein n=1 Tax=Actinokineospora globicatena TaxID=103729 RepID=A0A9W6QK04_9PSEU|nr:DinB family protein [Actinokineospora globicatena]GLW91853.1 hypothetical protein Aglo03_26690 [Actinokineospora globicatena]